MSPTYEPLTEADLVTLRAHAEDDVLMWEAGTPAHRAARLHLRALATIDAERAERKALAATFDAYSDVVDAARAVFLSWGRPLTPEEDELREALHGLIVFARAQTAVTP